MIPSSMNSTNFGHAVVVNSISIAAVNASSYAPESTVAEVAVTPTRLLAVARTARRTAGWITSTTEIPRESYRSRASRKAAEEAVLQAITNIFTPWSTRRSITVNACERTSFKDCGPYGPLAVSPTEITDSYVNCSM